MNRPSSFLQYQVNNISYVVIRFVVGNIPLTIKNYDLLVQQFGRFPQTLHLLE